ncbi:hypothetical protein KKE75_03865 [Patescibacteria group bacterium]|nr:hypothetical protein [Patescibacteria group bacterium]
MVDGFEIEATEKIVKEIIPANPKGDFLPDFVEALRQSDAPWHTYRIGTNGVEVAVPDAAMSIGLAVLDHIDDCVGAEHLTRSSTKAITGRLRERSTPENVKKGINFLAKRKALLQSLIGWGFGNEEQVTSIVGGKGFRSLKDWMERLWDILNHGFGFNWGRENFKTEFLVGLSQMTQLALSKNGLEGQLTPAALLAQEREASFQEALRHGLILKTGWMTLDSLTQFPLPVERLSQVLEVNGKIGKAGYRICLTTGYDNGGSRKDGRGHIYAEPSRDSPLLDIDKKEAIGRQLQISKILHDTGLIEVAEEWRADIDYIKDGCRLGILPNTFYFKPESQDKIQGSFQQIVDFFQHLEKLGLKFKGGKGFAHTPVIFSFNGLTPDEIGLTVETLDLDAGQVIGYASGWFFEWKVKDGKVELIREDNE